MSPEKRHSNTEGAKRCPFAPPVPIVARPVTAAGRFVFENVPRVYAGTHAAVGQTPAQAAQSVHLDASMM